MLHGGMRKALQYITIKTLKIQGRFKDKYWMRGQPDDHTPKRNKTVCVEVITDQITDCLCNPVKTLIKTCKDLLIYIGEQCLLNKTEKILKHKYGKQCLLNKTEKILKYKCGKSLWK